MLSKDLHLVTFNARNIRHVDHRHIHTDVTYILRLLTFHQTIAVPIAQMTVQSVGIANGDGGNHRIALNLAFPAVADRLTLGHMAQLQDGGLQR